MEQWDLRHYTGTEDYFGGSYGFGNDIIIKSYQTFSGLYTGMYAIYGDNREFYNGQQRFLLYHFHIADPVSYTHLTKDISLKRLGKPEDLAKPLVFLSSECASFITGCDIEITGGKFAVQDCDMAWRFKNGETK